MGKSREFEIAFVALKPGIHEFTYEVDDKFFAEDVARDFSNCTATIKLQLDKKSGFMLLKFEIGGKADVECDRCGNKSNGGTPNAFTGSMCRRADIFTWIYNNRQSRPV